MKTLAQKRTEEEWRHKRMKLMSVQVPYSKKDWLLILDVLKILAEDWLEREKERAK